MLPAPLCLPTYLSNYWEYVFVFEFVWKSLCEILSSHNENISRVEPPYYTGVGVMEYWQRIISKSMLVLWGIETISNRFLRLVTKNWEDENIKKKINKFSIYCKFYIQLLWWVHNIVSTHILKGWARSPSPSWNKNPTNTYINHRYFISRHKWPMAFELAPNPNPVQREKWTQYL